MACASTEEVPPPSAADKNQQTTLPPPSNPNVIPEAGASSTSSGGSSGTTGKTCVTKCTADTECQNSCPAQQNTIFCCDVKTGSCYGAKQTVCPSPTDDDGGGPPAY